MIKKILADAGAGATALMLSSTMRAGRPAGPRHSNRKSSNRKWVDPDRNSYIHIWVITQEMVLIVDVDGGFLADEMENFSSLPRHDNRHDKKYICIPPLRT